ncbi:hypothetical protein QN407_30335, partial [Pseudomonas sp. 10S4]|nr:hypothetical protein [Pseudomonas sp. 10S4]
VCQLQQCWMCRRFREQARPHSGNLPMLKSWNEKEIVTMPLHYRLGQPADALCISGLATQVFLDTYATSANRTTHDRRRGDLPFTCSVPLTVGPTTRHANGTNRTASHTNIM